MSASDVAAELKASVREYWQAQPCGSQDVTAEPGSAAFFAALEHTRDELEPFIPSFAQFDRWRDRDVLEIGFGLATDFVRFARGGARLHGVDLTEAAVDAARQRLALEGLDADVRVGDAEALPFEDASMDLVYSWGVLHHTPSTERAVAEVRRVLRPGGQARIMLYSRHSWVALGSWLHHGLAAGQPWHSFARVLAEHMESPGTKAYTQRELEQLFAGFIDVQMSRFVTPYDRRVGRGLVSLTGPRFGWFVGVIARRP